MGVCLLTRRPSEDATKSLMPFIIIPKHSLKTRNLFDYITEYNKIGSFG